jgi:hypothetical protein
LSPRAYGRRSPIALRVDRFAGTLRAVSRQESANIGRDDVSDDALAERANNLGVLSEGDSRRLPQPHARHCYGYLEIEPERSDRC